MLKLMTDLISGKVVPEQLFPDQISLLWSFQQLSIIRLRGLWVTAPAAESCPHFLSVSACLRNWP